VFNFQKADEDEAFELVDNKPVKKPYGSSQQRRPQQQQQQRWGPPSHHGNQQQQQRGGHQGRGGQHHHGRGHGYRQPWRDQRSERVLSESIVVRPEWQVLGDQIALPALGKLTTKVGEGETLLSAGALASYDRAADRVAPKLAAKLKSPSSVSATAVKTWDDHTMKKLAAGDEGDIFVTDLVLSVIMTAPRSIYPWDIVVKNVGGKLFMDRRSGSSLEMITNGETAPDPLQEDKENVNGIENLNAEATAVHQAFREQVLSTSKCHSIGSALPEDLVSAAVPPSGFKYKRFDLGSVRVIVRCEIDGHVVVANSVQEIAVHSLNEFDPKWSGIDWRTKLDTQRGAVLATELKNNASKMARWTAQALMGGVDVIKLGYISRASFKNSKSHQLLGTQTVKPRDFANQMNLSMDNAWGIAKALLIFMNDAVDEEGTYTIYL
jgi:translation initiation factor 3 subunit D